MILAALVLAGPTVLDILFLGNSHTAYGDVPTMVRKLIERSDLQVRTQFISGGLLQDIAQNPSAIQAIRTGGFEIVVLQGAGLSQSHQYIYPHDGAVKLANEAKRAKAKPLFFAEWSRRGIDETNYILGVYRKIARESGAEIMPICRTFDAALSHEPNLRLYAEDGNHSSIYGAYLAACHIATAIDAKAPLKYVPNGVDNRTARFFHDLVR